MTPTELDVVRLVGEGLGNKDIGTRLFISPRTVQTHLTHVYAKLASRRDSSWLKKQPVTTIPWCELDHSCGRW